MSIDRANAEILHKDHIPYTIISTQTVDYINNIDALAIWTYLQTKPNSWIIYKQEVAKHFKIGRDRCAKAFSKLEKIGLITIKQNRDSTGKFMNNNIHLHHSPFTENPLTEKPSTENKALVSNNSNKEITNNNIVYREKEKKQKKQKKLAHICPSDFQPSSETVEQLRAEGVVEDLDTELLRMKDHSVGSNWKKTNWDATYRNWMRKHKTDTQGQQNYAKSNRASSKADAWGAYYSKRVEQIKRAGDGSSNETVCAFPGIAWDTQS